MSTVLNISVPNGLGFVLNDSIAGWKVRDRLSQQKSNAFFKITQVVGVAVGEGGHGVDFSEEVLEQVVNQGLGRSLFLVPKPG